MKRGNLKKISILRKASLFNLSLWWILSPDSWIINDYKNKSHHSPLDSVAWAARSCTDRARPRLYSGSVWSLPVYVLSFAHLQTTWQMWDGFGLLATTSNVSIVQPTNVCLSTHIYKKRYANIFFWLNIYADIISLAIDRPVHGQIM